MVIKFCYTNIKVPLLYESKAKHIYPLFYKVITVQKRRAEDIYPPLNNADAMEKICILLSTKENK